MHGALLWCVVDSMHKVSQKGVTVCALGQSMRADRMSVSSILAKAEALSARTSEDSIPMPRAAARLRTTVVKLTASGHVPAPLFVARRGLDRLALKRMARLSRLCVFVVSKAAGATEVAEHKYIFTLCTSYPCNPAPCSRPAVLGGERPPRTKRHISKEGHYAFFLLRSCATKNPSVLCMRGRTVMACAPGAPKPKVSTSAAGANSRPSAEARKLCTTAPAQPSERREALLFSFRRCALAADLIGACFNTANTATFTFDDWFDGSKKTMKATNTRACQTHRSLRSRVSRLRTKARLRASPAPPEASPTRNTSAQQPSNRAKGAVR